MNPLHAIKGALSASESGHAQTKTNQNLFQEIKPTEEIRQACDYSSPA